jgi:predicted RND superfamily exporter protein
VTAAIHEIGISIVGGAATTLFSIVMLLFCALTLFSYFGLFVLMNILFSFISSLVFLVAILLIMGPRGNEGSFTYFFDFFKSKLGFSTVDEVREISNYSQNSCFEF